MSQNNTYVADIPLNSLDIDGLVFDIHVSGFLLNGNEKTNLVDIPTKDIDTISFSSKFNNLVSYGQIVFVDKSGCVDRIMCNNMSFIQLQIEAGPKKTDGDVVKYEREYKVNCTFLVQHVKILDKQESQIRYQIDMVSENSLRLIDVIDDSSYGENRGFFEMVQKYLSTVNVETSEDFLADDTKKLARYITNGQDNVENIYKYISNRIYEDNLHDMEGLMGVYYNYLDGKIHSATLGKGIRRMVMKGCSFTENGIGMMFSGDKRERMGSVVRRPSIDVFKSMFGVRKKGYSFSGGDVTCAYVYKPETIVNIYADKNRGYQALTEDEKHSVYRNVSQWDDSTTIYYDLVSNLIDHNSPILEMTGVLSIMVGDTIVINMMDKPRVGQDSYGFSEFCGGWDIVKVDNTIDLNKRHHIQRLCLAKCHTNDV